MSDTKVRLPKQNWRLLRESKRSHAVLSRPIKAVLNRPLPQAMFRPPLNRTNASSLEARSAATGTSVQPTVTGATPLQISTRSLTDSSLTLMPATTGTQHNGTRIPSFLQSMSKCSRMHQLIILVVLGVFFIWLDSRMNLSSQWSGRLSYPSRYKIRQAPVDAKCHRWLKSHQFLFVHIGGLQRSGTTLLKQAVGSQPASFTMGTASMKHLLQLAPWTLHNQSADYFKAVVDSGGLEGKAVQDVYPYMYLLSNVGAINKNKIASGGKCTW